MFHRLALLSLLAVGPSLASTGCFDRPKPECAFLCGAGDACPDGYACAGDGWCKRVGVDPGFDCTGAGVVDAATADAPVVDASDIDAPPAPDAAVDAANPPDAMVDAMPPDAMPPDAMPDAFVNSAPTLTVPGDNPRVIDVDVQDTFTVTATDPDIGQTVTLGAAFPSGSSALDPFGVSPPPTFTPGTGVFEWTPPTGSEGTYEVEFTATDDHTTPASDTEVLVITVQ